MLIVVPFHLGDLQLAKSLLSWMALLKRNRGHTLLLVTDQEMPDKAVSEMKSVAATCGYDSIRAIKVIVPPDRQGYPKVSNFMFCKTLNYIQKNFKTHFFWCEPDCVPLISGWQDKLDWSYRACPTKFMGAIIDTTKNPHLGDYHVSGCSVFPMDAYQFFTTGGRVCETCDLALDVVYAQAQLAATTGTMLIQQWTEGRHLPKEKASLSLLDKKAVIFHADKHHSLIPLLKQKL